MIGTSVSEPHTSLFNCDFSYTSYSGKISLVQIFAEMRPYPSEEIFAIFIFAERKRDALTTPLPDDGHTPHARVTLLQAIGAPLKQRKLYPTVIVVSNEE